MVEVPSAAIMAEGLAAEADFLSVDTNELTQYALAMGRLNPALAPHVYAFHPAVLRLIARAVEGARAWALGGRVPRRRLGGAGRARADRDRRERVVSTRRRRPLR